MKKLEDIPKESIFKVPDGYFERLPGVVQSRIAQPRSRWSMEWKLALRYALPMVVVLAAGLYWLLPGEASLETELSAIPAEQIALYLEDADLRDDDLHDETDLSKEDLDQLEDDIYSQMEISNDLQNEIIDALDPENL